MSECKFKEEDFTYEELMLLRIAFGSVEHVVDTLKEGNCDVRLSNELFSLKEKLGVSDIV